MLFLNIVKGIEVGGGRKGLADTRVLFTLFCVNTKKTSFEDYFLLKLFEK